MAELEIAIPCRTPVHKVGFAITTALMPFWALFIPYLLGGFLQQIIVDPNALPASSALALITALLSVPLAGIASSGLFEDDRIYISKNGLSFPLLFWSQLKGKHHRAWSELAVADVLATPGNAPQSLALTFTDGAYLNLPLKLIPAELMEQLLLGIELWGGEKVTSLSLRSYQTCLQNENRGIAGISHTQLWEDELARRFSNTAFIPLEPGSILRNGSLKIIRQLAFGGLSAIYLAQKDGIDMVTLKESVIPANIEQQIREKAEEQFIREARLLVTLNHSNIAHVLDHFVDSGRNYLMLEYIHGQDLRQYIKQNGRQDEKTVLTWAAQIVEIVKFLHTQHPPIIHRDLTPDNLVLDTHNEITLIDFGAANLFVGTATGTLIGKQAYMAPEQLRGKASLSSDLYSLGATLYFLSTGMDPMPLSQSNTRQIVPELSKDFDYLVSALTAFESADRPNSAAATADIIRSVLQQTAIPGCSLSESHLQQHTNKAPGKDSAKNENTSPDTADSNITSGRTTL